MEENIFLEIMSLIERKTDIPMLEKDIKSWLTKDDKNKSIYEIYVKASKARNI